MTAHACCFSLLCPPSPHLPQVSWPLFSPIASSLSQCPVSHGLALLLVTFLPVPKPSTVLCPTKQSPNMAPCIQVPTHLSKYLLHCHSSNPSALAEPTSLLSPTCTGISPSASLMMPQVPGAADPTATKKPEAPFSSRHTPSPTENQSLSNHLPECFLPIPPGMFNLRGSEPHYWPQPLLKARRPWPRTVPIWASMSSSTTG